MLHDREAKSKAAVATATRTPAPTPVVYEAQPVTISNLTGDARIIDVLDDGTEIVYEGDAARGTAATLSGDTLAQAPKGTAAVSVAAADVHRKPAPKPAPATPPSSRSLPKVSAVTAAAMPVANVPAEPAIAITPVAPRVAIDVVAKPAPKALSRAWPSDAPTLYQEALAELKQGQHDAAVEGLTLLIAKFPTHEYADNAQYWIGEAYYDRRKFSEALVAFQTTIASYPKGNKSADATLKAGLCLVSLGQVDRAGEYLRRVLNLYPTSDSARIASERLLRLSSVSTSTSAAASTADRSPSSDTSVRTP